MRPWLRGSLVLAAALPAHSQAASGPPCGPSVQALLADARSLPSSLSGVSYCDCVLDATTLVTPLHQAVIIASTQGTQPGLVVVFIGKLMSAGANVLSTDSNADTALHLACRFGLLAGVSAIVNAAAQQGKLRSLLQTTNKRGLKPMGEAIGNFQIAVAKFLLQNGDSLAEIPANPAECRGSLLKNVMELNNPKLAKDLSLLPSNFSNCLVPYDDQQRTLLHLAAAAAELVPPPAGATVVRTLLKGGANATLADRLGQVPLFTAVSVAQEGAATALLAASPDTVNLRDRTGSTPLLVAAATGASSCVGVLLSYGADANAKNPLGQTAAALAAQNGFSEVSSMIRNAASAPKGMLNMSLFSVGGGTSTAGQSSMSSGGQPGLVTIIVAVVCASAVALTCGVLIFCGPRWMKGSLGGLKVGVEPVQLEEDEIRAIKAKRPAKLMQELANIGSSDSEGGGVSGRVLGKVTAVSPQVVVKAPRKGRSRDTPAVKDALRDTARPREASQPVGSPAGNTKSGKTRPK